MRSDEMVEGESYALEVPGTDECRKITLVSTTTARRGSVKVRLDDPQADRRELEVPSRRVKSDWRDYRAAALELVDTPHFRDVAWLPRCGEVVERSDAPALWIARDVNLKTGRAIVEGVLVGMRRKEAIPLERLRRANPPPAPDRAQAEKLVLSLGLGLSLPRRSSIYPVDDWTAASQPTPSPRQIATRLVFSSIAQMQYRWIDHACPEEQAAAAMARDLATVGRVRWLDEGDRGYQEGEYIRYSVPHRFEVVLVDDPAGREDEIYVDRIVVLPRRRRRQRKRRR